jgi:hypothetical protein
MLRATTLETMPDARWLHKIVIFPCSEYLLSYTHTDSTRGQESACQLNEFTCSQMSNGTEDTCIPRWQVCNQQDDCGSNGADDENPKLCGVYIRPICGVLSYCRVFSNVDENSIGIFIGTYKNCCKLLLTLE